MNQHKGCAIIEQVVGHRMGAPDQVLPSVEIADHVVHHLVPDPLLKIEKVRQGKGAENTQNNQHGNNFHKRETGISIQFHDCSPRRGYPSVQLPSSVPTGF